jgi:Na+:H+ antiporter, NhaA family
MSTRSTLAFLKTETGSGLLLVLAAVIAIVWANSPWGADYHALVDYALPIQFGPFQETKSIGEWIKSALMPIFFFVVGLEIKHEIFRGELSSPRRLVLPVVGALGGVIVPALIYLAMNSGAGGAPHGWPVPVATDIAFALAALAVAAPRLPATLRIFLLALAIADDLAAVALIAVLYSQELRPAMLGGALAALVGLITLARVRGAPRALWMAGGLLLWAFTLKSGIDTSLAGVAAAFCVPLEPRRPGGRDVLNDLMEMLHPYVAFLILPIFALTAAGFTLSGMTLSSLTAPATLGIALALVVGKPLGVFGAAALVIGLGWARRPTGAKWIELLGVSVLCGIGFTMSLYIGLLAFPPGGAVSQSEVRMGVVAGSVLSALIGMALLAWTGRRRPVD